MSLPQLRALRVQAFSPLSLVGRESEGGWPEVGSSIWHRRALRPVVRSHEADLVEMIAGFLDWPASAVPDTQESSQSSC